ncbi:Protein MTO1-like protein, mitochondrial [Plecturocebus cupreus]
MAIPLLIRSSPPPTTTFSEAVSCCIPNALQCPPHNRWELSCEDAKYKNDLMDSGGRVEDKRRLTGCSVHRSDGVLLLLTRLECNGTISAHHNLCLPGSKQLYKRELRVEVTTDNSHCSLLWLPRKSRGSLSCCGEWCYTEWNSKDIYDWLKVHIKTTFVTSEDKRHFPVFP